ncbi:hypothetical protein NQ314_003559 [Rhamnusium bicolor]|uniref:Uncharacterized protein n=1 Tax=Rhamnusium bicolor TaxID=1586634 RepID=A0AAV8ZLT3_9CUCU|nr:hypothetical protein NQ314_003559 [Rhamnusium bicolor]
MCIFKRCFSNIRDDFFNYINEDEKQIIEKGLKDLDDVDQDELDVLSRYECKTLPTKENFGRIINELAEHEIIQKTTFISDSFYDVIGNMLTSAMLHAVYEDCKPISRNILKKY